jgi:peptidoglycan/xylan/chitin deacetylase (PgdA/CDA1 family)
MNPFRPLLVVAGLAFLIGLVLIISGIVASRSEDASPSMATFQSAESQADDSDDSDVSQQAMDLGDADDSDDGADESPGVTPAANDDAHNEVEQDLTPSPDDEPALELLSDEELQRYQPNELGQIMVLMYHRIHAGADPNDVWSRTPDQFREDLQWLYDNDFYIIPIRDYIRNEISAPAGKRPVVLTFDDGTAGQFRMLEGADGSVMIDPDSAVGILEDFASRHDDFAAGGLFSILPLAPFAWPDAEDQRQYAERKLQWLIENGYELGNHTVGHVNMREISDDEIKSELARAEDMIRDLAPEAEVSVLAVPFGIYPTGGDTTIFRGWEYEGREYQLEGALMVGAEPAPSPVHVDFDPMWIPRINGDDSELGRWFSFVEANPGMMYVSDGNPDTITIPEDIHPWLVGTLDEAKAEGKTIIRY